MAKLIDITGQTFGELTVLEFSHVDKRRQSFWRCRCSCGKETIVAGRSLKSSDTKSCGCYRKSTVIPEDEKEIRKIDKKFRCTKEYEMLLDVVWEKSGGNCEICNGHLERKPGKGGGQVAHLSSLKNLNYNFEWYHRIENLSLLCRTCHRRLDILKGEIKNQGPNAMEGQESEPYLGEDVWDLLL